MSDVGTARALYCQKCRGTTSHTYERRVGDGGISVSGAEWRSCTYGWVCACCGTLAEPLEDREECDRITGEWQPRSRRSVRIPIVGQRLDTDIKADGGRYWAPAGINLSMSGILVEFFPANMPDLENGAKVQVTLRFESHLVGLFAEVKRRERRQYGIAFFPDTANEASFKPEPLRALVAALEQRWLAARVR